MMSVAWRHGQALLRRWASLLALTTGMGAARARSSNRDGSGADVVAKMPGLVAFWTFGEAEGQPRRSTGGDRSYALLEVGGSVACIDEGPYSGRSAVLDGRHYFWIPREQSGCLNIKGKDAEVSVFAAIRLDNLDHGVSIAGMWDEGHGEFDDTGTRQYAMLLNMPVYGGHRQLTPHISAEGGVSRRHDGSALPWNVDYAAGLTPVPVGRWVTLGFTYDAGHIRAYIDGRLDRRTVDPQADNRTDRYFTQEGLAGGNRGINPYYHGRGIFDFDELADKSVKPRGGSNFTVGATFAGGTEFKHMLVGRIGGLAVFDRALTDAQMAALHASARTDRL